MWIFAAGKASLVDIYIIMIVKNIFFTFQKASEGVPKYILLKQMQSQQQKI